MTETEFLTLIDQHRRIIQKLCRSYRFSPEERRDLFQDILFELFKARHSFEGRSNISTWIHRIAFNTATDMFKKKRDIIRLSEIRELKADGDEWAEKRNDLLEAMRYLTDKEKSIFMLYMEQLSYEEIAEVTEMTISHTGVVLHRIKTKIRNILNKK
jgi:RNA polymerase sigma factor (sigma-70 family)